MNARETNGDSAAIRLVLLAGCVLAMGCSSSGSAAPGGNDAGSLDAASGADGGGGGAGDGATGSDATGAPSDSGSNEGGSGLDGGSATQACSDYVSAYCSRYKACSSYWFGRQYGDDATCRARISIGCTNQFTAPGVTWTPAGLEGCAGAMPTADCHALIMLDGLPSACTPTPGTLPSGSGCATSAQCAGQVCVFGSFGSCGTCQDITPDGGVCFTSDQCGAGALCYGSSSPGNCTPFALENGSCNGAPCAPWLVCNGSGVCAKPEGLDGGCSSDPNAFDPCDTFAGVLCDNDTMMCAARTPDLTNQSCAGNSVCSASYLCTTSGGCTPPIKEGDFCSILSGPDCLAPSRCDNGLCTLPDPVACSAPKDAGTD
jgi:hypothetical protein